MVLPQRLYFKGFGSLTLEISQWVNQKFYIISVVECAVCALNQRKFVWRCNKTATLCYIIYGHNTTVLQVFYGGTIRRVVMSSLHVLKNAWCSVTYQKSRTCIWNRDARRAIYLAAPTDNITTRTLSHSSINRTVSSVTSQNRLFLTPPSW